VVAGGDSGFLSLRVGLAVEDELVCSGLEFGTSTTLKEVRQIE
jgi:hypothetical protein